MNKGWHSWYKFYCGNRIGWGGRRSCRTKTEGREGRMRSNPLQSSLYLISAGGGGNVRVGGKIDSRGVGGRSGNCRSWTIGSRPHFGLGPTRSGENADRVLQELPDQTCTECNHMWPVIYQISCMRQLGFNSLRELMLYQLDACSSCSYHKDWLIWKRQSAVTSKESLVVILG